MRDVYRDDKVRKVSRQCMDDGMHQNMHMRTPWTKNVAPFKSSLLYYITSVKTLCKNISI